jgi:hypothetical protein
VSLNGNYNSNSFRELSPIFKAGDILPTARKTLETLDFEDRALSTVTIISAKKVTLKKVNFQANWIADNYGTS